MSEKIESVEALIARVEAAHPNTGRTALATYFEAVHQELAPVARSLERRVAELENELAESIAVRDRMGELLTKTAEAVHGKQPADSPYDWHDVPARVAAAMAGLGAATHSFYIEHERAEMMAEIVRGVVDVVTTDFESKEAFVARVRAILGDDPSLHVSEIRKEHDACGVVAIADTPESAATVRDMREEYWSASCDDVARRVDECIALRTERDSLRFVCGEAYQMAGTLNAPTKALDNLSAASVGHPLPHETFLPVMAPDSEEQKLKRDLLEAFARIGVIDGEPGWIEHYCDKRKAMVRDALTLSGELNLTILPAVEAIKKERDALAAKLKALRARAIELEAETKSSEEMQTLKFCEREWSTERAAMMNTINALRNCGDAHPVPARELTDEEILNALDAKVETQFLTMPVTYKELWLTAGSVDVREFVRAIECYLKGEGE